MIKNNYERAIAEKDARVYFISGDGMLGADGCGTVDGCHPNSLGFYNIAAALEPLLEKLLNKHIK